MNIKKSLTVIVLLFVIVAASFFFSGDDKKQITEEIHNHANVTNILHIELLDDNTSVAFVETNDGNEMEIYLEKALLSWKLKRTYTFVNEGVNEHFHLSFFNSPFDDEENLNAVLVRVFDNQIEGVRIEEDKNIIHDFKLLTKETGERFGLLRTESDYIFNSKYIAYNSQNEVVYTNKPGE